MEKVMLKNIVDNGQNKMKDGQIAAFGSVAEIMKSEVLTDILKRRQKLWMGHMDLSRFIELEEQNYEFMNSFRPSSLKLFARGYCSGIIRVK